jgi:hypothetical protein
MKQQPLISSFFEKTACQLNGNPYLHGPLTGGTGRAKGKIEKIFEKVFAREWRSGKVGGVEGVDPR